MYGKISLFLQKNIIPMSDYTSKNSELIRKFADYFAQVAIDGKFKDNLLNILNVQKQESNTVKEDDGQFMDLRAVIFNQGKICDMFPVINVVDNKEKEKADAVISGYVGYELNDLDKVMKKDEYRTEDLEEFVNVTYRPLKNLSNNDKILQVYFNISFFVFSNQRVEYIVKPNIQYILTDDFELNEDVILKFIR